MRKSDEKDQPFTVYFDGGCPVCSKEIDTYRKVKGSESMAWVDAAHCDQDALGEDLDSTSALARMHVRDERGNLIGGAAAFAAIWARLPRTRLLGKIMGTRPALWVLEPMYSLFLRIRPFWRKPASRV